MNKEYRHFDSGDLSIVLKSFGKQRPDRKEGIEMPRHIHVLVKVLSAMRHATFACWTNSIATAPPIEQPYETTFSARKPRSFVRCV